MESRPGSPQTRTVSDQSFPVPPLPPTDRGPGDGSAPLTPPFTVPPSASGSQPAYPGAQQGSTPPPSAYPAPPAFPGAPASPPAYTAPAQQQYPAAGAAHPAAPPAYGLPGYGYGYAPAGAYAGRPAPGQSGTVAWAMGFLAFIPIPFIGQIAAMIVMIFVGLSQRRKSPVAATNGRSAANWAITYILATVVLLGLFIAGIASGGGDPTTSAFGVIGLVLYFAWFFLLNPAHLILTIIGTVKASSGKPFRCPLAIPFIRPDEMEQPGR